jgi:ubiquinone/menaquinone biosynthesis C-methylase UbiE
MPDFSDFLEVQTRTAWGRTLADFASFCDPEPVARTLDVGCGPGLLPAIFSQKGCRSLGVDIDFSLLTSHLSLSLAVANAFSLPFPAGTFNLVTAVNLLFLLDNPIRALQEMVRVVKPSGQICLLNPSEHISVEAATLLADERGLQGKARGSLLNWARNAEEHIRWTEGETKELLAAAKLELVESVLRVGPGFARYVQAHRK